MLNNMKRVPICLMWTLLMIITFTFVDYEWITVGIARGMFVLFVLIGGACVTGMNHDFQFWVYKKP